MLNFLFSAVRRGTHVHVTVELDSDVPQPPTPRLMLGELDMDTETWEALSRHLCYGRSAVGWAEIEIQDRTEDRTEPWSERCAFSLVRGLRTPAVHVFSLPPIVPAAQGSRG